MATSWSACIVPQNTHLAGVDCEAISAQVSGRGYCQHTDAQAVGKRSDIEAAGGGPNSPVPLMDLSFWLPLQSLRVQPAMAILIP